jgi:hypothetical protein
MRLETCSSVQVPQYRHARLEQYLGKKPLCLSTVSLTYGSLHDADGSFDILDLQPPRFLGTRFGSDGPYKSFMVGCLVSDLAKYVGYTRCELQSRVKTKTDWSLSKSVPTTQRFSCVTSEVCYRLDGLLRLCPSPSFVSTFATFWEALLESDWLYENQEVCTACS